MSFNIKISERKIKMAFDRLIENIVKTQNPSVVGLDPKLDYVPEYIKEKKFKKYGKTLKGAAKAIWEFNKTIIDEIHDICPAIKPQAAYYEMYGYEGVKTLYKTIQYAKEKGMFVMTDGKRNDIGATMEAYATAAGCQHDDRNFGVDTNFPAYLPSVHLRHHCTALEKNSQVKPGTTSR